jgi:Rieske Fe-S protein
MERRDFIVKSCAACAGIAFGTALLQSCTPSKFIQGKLGKDGLSVDPKEFLESSGTGKKFRPYIIIRNNALQYPICLYRFSDEAYSALWMQCTHQGAELSVSGDRLQCQAHGSEFDSKGTVKNGPADRHLRNFPVTVNDNEIFIDLRAI